MTGSLGRAPKGHRGAAAGIRKPITSFGAFSVGLVLGELVHALVRESKQSGGVTSAHLQRSDSQQPDDASNRAGCPSVFFVGLLAQSRVGPNCLRRSCAF